MTKKFYTSEIQNKNNKNNKNSNSLNIKKNEFSKISQKMKNVFEKEKQIMKEEFIGGGLGKIGNVLSGIGKFFTMLGKYIVILVKFIIWLIKFIIFLFTLLNPVTLIKTLPETSMLIANGIVNSLILTIKKIGSYVINNILLTISNKFFGFIQKKDHNEINSNDKQKCYKTPEGKKPMNIIIATILLPPLGVFMEYGLVRWADIMITGGLTMLFYFPGLIYALIIIFNKNISSDNID